MKKITYVAAALAVAGFSFGQAKKLVIEYKNGARETKTVEEIARLTFADENEPGTGEPDPSEQMVDMGLSVKWAAWNVGAAAPEEYGAFYAYGEIKEKDDYTYSNYKWRNPEPDENFGEWDQYFRLGANISGTNYDAAHTTWGDKWRMPTTDEWQELFDNCSKSWSTQKGVTGVTFTSNITGKSIFIPAAGNKYNGTYDHEGTNCLYWSPEEPAEFNADDPSQECRNYRIDICQTYSNCDGYDYPYIGFPIRPVYGELPAEILPTVTSIPAAAEAIDLGLPSGTLWAPYNVGATTQTERGLYFAYGELTEKAYAHVFNYKYYDPITGGYNFPADGEIQGTEYDAATVLWGDGWMMPNKEQIEELINECDWRSNGSGMTVTGPNGNKIFLPVVDQTDYIGLRYQNDVLYPSSTVSNTKAGLMYGIAATQRLGGTVQDQPTLRTWMSVEAGHAIRPVRNK